MGVPSAILGFLVFRSFGNTLELPFSVRENAYIQGVAGAVGSMPMTGGLVSTIVGLERVLPKSDGGAFEFDWSTLVLWSLGVCFFGAVFTTFTRQRILEQERLIFPSATASATTIESLHRSWHGPSADDDEARLNGQRRAEAQAERNLMAVPINSTSHAMVAFAVSGSLALLAAFVPVLHAIPFLGSSMADKWLWTFNLFPGIFGQGIVTGPAVTLHMFLGTVVGWAILSPIARSNGWAPGPVGDWDTGSRGWILWIGLATLLTESFINIAYLLLSLPSIKSKFVRLWQWLELVSRRLKLLLGGTSSLPEVDDSNAHSPSAENRAVPPPVLCDSHTEPKSKAPNPTVLRFSLIAAILACTGTTLFTFSGRVSLPEIFSAILITLPLAIASTRSMGQTDFSPVSGLGKFVQFLFALFVSKSDPNRFVIGLVVGAIAEAGTMQAAILMFNLKTGKVLGADPSQQLLGHAVGSSIGAFVAVGLYKLYTTAIAVPGDLFQVPAAYVSVSAVRLAWGSGLPPRCTEFSIAFAALTALITALKIRYATSSWAAYLPGGVAFSVGLYNAPSFVLPRVMGGFVFWYACSRLGQDPMYMRLIAAGLIVGESLFGLANLVLARN